MGTKSVQALLEDIRLLDEQRFSVVLGVLTVVQRAFPAATQEVKYGGVLVSAGVPFCGVFAYSQHVSVDFSHGAKIVDSFGYLEGTGKGRRHLKLRALADIQSKRLAEYLPLAYRASGGL
jgi:hypothetical protein